MEYIRLEGTGVSPGIAIGKALLSKSVVFTSRKEIISADQVSRELDRLNQALEGTHQQLVQLKDKVREQMGEEHSFIFEAHLMILEDKSLVLSLKNQIEQDFFKAEWAISQIHEKYMQIFNSIEDEYFRERKSDFTDVLSKLYHNLEPEITKQPDEDEDRILVAHDLLPSEAALRLSRGNVLGVALDVGGTTSHTAILARSLNIPAVMGLRNITQRVKDDDVLVVDGTAGEILIDPPQAIQREFLSKQKKYDDYLLSLQKTATLKPRTLDGFCFSPQANIELPEEVQQALNLGAEGIGLFRSEFIYFQSVELPDEEDHFKIYSRIAQEAAPLPVHIRTIDIGGEKNLPQMRIKKEPNPALGLRAIRFSLRDKNIFRIQIRAILRASVSGNVRILIPMITELEEVYEVKRLLQEEKQKLSEQDIPFDDKIPLGIMIEVPAAAALSDKIVQEADYLSIGTNDLIQYYLAVDRSNELVSYLFKPLHPSVLRLLKFIIECAEKEGKGVTVCGEMAADPLSAIFLLGLGLKNYSMNPIFIPRIKRALRSVEYQTVKKIVQKAMALKTAQEVEEFFIESILVRHPTALLMGEYPANEFNNSQ